MWCDIFSILNLIGGTGGRTGGTVNVTGGGVTVISVVPISDTLSVVITVTKGVLCFTVGVLPIQLDWGGVVNLFITDGCVDSVVLGDVSAEAVAVGVWDVCEGVV